MLPTQIWMSVVVDIVSDLSQEPSFGDQQFEIDYNISDDLDEVLH